MNAVDAEIVEQYKLQIEDIARVYRVPLFMLGSMEKSTFNNVEQMTRSFYAGGLAFYLELIEAQLARFFSLPMDEFVEFDVDSGLMRSEFKDRVDALTKGVQGGVFAPNEARRREGLPGVPYGDQPMVQQQMVPLSYAAQQTVDNAGSVVEPVEESIVVADPEKMVALVRKEFGIAA
jgi:phage portal protein BeeE